MCLAIPGQIVSLVDEPTHGAIIDVIGVRRRIDISLVEPEGIAPGDWVLIHVGFALSKIKEEDAYDQLRMLSALGETEAAVEEVRGYLDDVERSLPGRFIPMKFTDEFREPELIRAHRRRDPAAGRSRAALSLHGSVRRPYARHLSFRLEGSAAAEYRTGPWPRLPGVRAAHGPHRRRPLHRRANPMSFSRPSAT